MRKKILFGFLILSLILTACSKSSENDSSSSLVNALVGLQSKGNYLKVINEFSEEAKPDVKISQDVFDQVARYNIVFKVSYLFVSNGLKHYCCKVNFQTGEVHFLSEIPEFGALT